MITLNTNYSTKNNNKQVKPCFGNNTPSIIAVIGLLAGTPPAIANVATTPLQRDSYIFTQPPANEDYAIPKNPLAPASRHYVAASIDPNVKGPINFHNAPIIEDIITLLNQKTGNANPPVEKGYVLVNGEPGAVAAVFRCPDVSRQVALSVTDGCPPYEYSATVIQEGQESDRRLEDIITYMKEFPTYLADEIRAYCAESNSKDPKLGPEYLQQEKKPTFKITHQPDEDNKLRVSYGNTDIGGVPAEDKCLFPSSGGYSDDLGGPESYNPSENPFLFNGAILGRLRDNEILGGAPIKPTKPREIPESPNGEQVSIAATTPLIALGLGLLGLFAGRGRGRVMNPLKILK